MDTIDVIERRPVRSTATWTPDLLRVAEWEADAGRLRLAADLWETMLADDRLKGVHDARTDALLGRPLRFEGRSARVVASLDVKEDWWRIFPETELKELMGWGLGVGAGLGHMVWGTVDGRDVPRLVVKNPRNLRWCWRERGWFFRTGVDGNETALGEEIRIYPGDGNWVLYTPYGSRRPWVHGAYRTLGRWSLLKQYAIDDWADYSDRKGQGVHVATGAKGTTEERRKITADLKVMAGNAAITLPDGMDLKLVEAVANTWSTFKAQIDAANEAIAVTLLGQNMSTLAGASGNQSAATLQGDVKLTKTKADAEVFSTFAHDQVLVHYAAANSGDPTRAPWPIYDTTPVEDRKASAAVEQMDAQTDATLVGAGIMTIDEAREKRGYPPKAPPATRPTPADDSTPTDGAAADPASPPP